jgi:Calcineurin-like phosphoesterase
MTDLTPAVTAVMVCGDWHGNVSWASHCLRTAKAEGIDTIIQVGDFGYWEHTNDGVYYLDKLSENAQLRGVNVVWLDGNHENHTMLRAKYADAEKSVEGFWKIRDNVWHSPRANVWNWWGKRLMTLGGAYSIDRAYRTFGKSYWAEEEITPEEEALAISRGKVDYLFTHDAPTNYPAPLFKADLNSEAQRQTVSRVADAVRPTRWFHGHYHDFHDYPYPRYDPFCRVTGLDMDGKSKSMYVFDLLLDN